MTLSRQRAFTSPLPGEDWSAIAQRALPDMGTEEALEHLRSWNLHLFMRQPSGRVLGADVIFTEPPQASE